MVTLVSGNVLSIVVQYTRKLGWSLCNKELSAD